MPDEVVMKIGDKVTIPAPSRPGLSYAARVVSFDEQTVCVRVETENLSGELVDVLHWVPRDAVKPLDD
jgi:hypothetical protein